VGHEISDRRLSVSLLAAISIAAIELELPVLAVPQPAPVQVAQVACVIRKQAAVYTTEDPEDPEVLPRTLTVGTAVALTAPLPTVPPMRVQINKPQGFVNYASLDCGRERKPLTSAKTTACRKVRNTVNSMYVFREPSWAEKTIERVFAGQSVYVTQSGGVTTSRVDANGEGWVEVDLQRTFGRNFGISSGVGWLSNTDPNSQLTTLVNRCGS